MIDMRNFTLKDMVECSAAIRLMWEGTTSMEQVADKIVRYLYDHLIDGDTGERAFALIRFFKTHPLEELEEDSRKFALDMLQTAPESPNMKCLALLASAGVEPQWASRKESKGHRAIPLVSEQFVDRFPMVRQLIQQFGLEVNTVLQPDSEVVYDMAEKAYNVFHVSEAVGSQYVPAQENFVIPYGVRSVLGFGGILPSGNLFAVIMFSKIPIDPETANMFRTLAMSVKVAILPHVGKPIFD